MEIFRGWRRIRRPLKASSGPGILASHLAVAHGPGEIEHREQIAERENRSAGGGKDVEHLKFRRIGVVAARHAEIAKNELREEREVKTDEERDGGDARKSFGIEPSGNFRPPEVDTADV